MYTGFGIILYAAVMLPKFYRCQEFYQILSWDRFCTLGRAPRTKETLPDFREWCRVTRHPRVFRGLTGCQRDTPVLGRHIGIMFLGTKTFCFENSVSHTWLRHA